MNSAVRKIKHRCLTYSISITCKYEDGDFIAGETPNVIGTVWGPAAAILKGERIALNILSRCSGISTQARKLIDAGYTVAGSRKTTPGFRLMEKYALAVGGADPHRYDATSTVMLKDNHIDALGGNITAAIDHAKSLASFTTKVEVECRTIEEAVVAAESGADIVMLDNFLPSMADLERLQRFGVIIELSGGFTPHNIPPNFKSQIVSLGYLTHSAPIIDFSLKINKLLS